MQLRECIWLIISKNVIVRPWEFTVRFFSRRFPLLCMTCQRMFRWQNQNPWQKESYSHHRNTQKTTQEYFGGSLHIYDHDMNHKWTWNNWIFQKKWTGQFSKRMAQNWTLYRMTAERIFVLFQHGRWNIKCSSSLVCRKYFLWKHMTDTLISLLMQWAWFISVGLLLYPVKKLCFLVKCWRWKFTSFLL